MDLPGALRLYLVVGRGDCAGRPLTQVVEQAALGGVTAVQLREKGLDSAATSALARELMAVLEPFGLPLVVNDDLEATLASAAAALHVGQEDMPAAEARKRLPASCRLGLSITEAAQVPAALAGPADHFGVGPIYATQSKADAAPALGPEGLAEICALLPGRPVVAIGGINLARVGEVIASGAEGIAVVSAIASAPDPRTAALALRRAVEDSLTERMETR